MGLLKKWRKEGWGEEEKDVTKLSWQASHKGCDHKVLQTSTKRKTEADKNST